MASEITNYQCPNCTGPMHFDGVSGKVKCDFCESMFDTAEIEAMYKEKEEKAIKALEVEEAKPWIDEGMHAYSCPSCGAELICDETTAATSCPYCGNPSIVPGQMAGTLKPDYIIPFKLEKENAKAALRQHYQKKFFLPKSFQTDNHIEEVKGVYVPFWLFDCTAYGQAGFKAEKVIVDNSEKTVKDIYQATRGGEVKFEKIPADASVQMPDDMMDSIEPYDYKDLTEFSTVYMPGFLADKYDVTQEESIERFSERAKNTLVDMLEENVREEYDNAYNNGNDIAVKDVSCKYAMFPVWMLSTKWNGQNFLFAMNGQTGNMVGDLPCDKKKRALTTVLMIIGSLLLGGITSAIMDEFFWGFAIGIIVTVITILSLNAQLKSVEKATKATHYADKNTFIVSKRIDHFIRQEVEYKSNDD